MQGIHPVTQRGDGCRLKGELRKEHRRTNHRKRTCMIEADKNNAAQTEERPLKIKICGLTLPGNVEAVSALKPDFAGFIFHPGSKRYVGEHPDPALFRIPEERTAKVGVFVDEPVPRVKKLFESYLLDLVQLHGSESPEYCRELVDAGVPVIKAVHVGQSGTDLQDRQGNLQDAFDALHLDRYWGAAHYLLFDSGSSGSGGSGKQFDWSLLSGRNIPLPFLLGGGIGPEDATALRQFAHPSLFGVDLNSRFESSPGIKDPELLRLFMEKLRKQDQGNETPWET
ncbi:MAG: phosphoribosylanthranilate isomerase [Bacteroidales bacterium]